VSVGDLVRAGRIDEADRIALEAFEIGEASGQPDARFVFLIQRAVIRFGQGRLGELEPELSAMSALFPSVPGAAALVAAAYCQRGAEAEARSPFDRLAAVSFELPKDPLWLGFLTMAADVACRLGDHRSASTLYDLLRPYTEVFPVLSAVSTGSTDHYLGMLAVVTGRAADAEEHFRAAAATHERMQAPIWLARTRLEWARMLLARRQPGDAERARELLGQALATARELGLAHIERGAVQLLRSW
jgi:tetratricopeptide (TPR) repeat protein